MPQILIMKVSLLLKLVRDYWRYILVGKFVIILSGLSYIKC